VIPSPPLADLFADAARAVAAVLDGASLSEALPADRHPAVQDLVYGTLREYGRGDAWLAQLLRRPLNDVAVRALLLCALHALRSERRAAHTVVDQAVRACAQLGHAAAKGLVNAVLRNALRRRAALEQALERDEAARYAHPRWWIERLRRDYPDVWAQILEAGNGHPPMTLRVNRRRLSREAYLQHLREAGIEACAVGDYGIRLARPRPVHALPGFDEGDVSVQDAAAQYAAPLLDLEPGQRVLDACAAPGGKTAQLLETADLDLLALDRDPARAGRIEQNLRRLHLHAEVRVADAGEPEAWWDGRPYDRVLLDVPCTGSGVVRRHPDIKWLRRESDIAGFAAQQRRLLNALWRVLRRGGKLLYITCSVFAEENRLQIADFLARHTDARPLPTALPREGQLLPNDEHDGFYYALLEKH